MTSLTSKTSVALLIVALRKSYGQAWFHQAKPASGSGNDLVVGLHTPAGEVVYRIPGEYLSYLKGLIEVPKQDLLDVPTEAESADRLLEWSAAL